MSLVIAVDGPAASGKGTLAKCLAKHFNLEYLDTGKLYRAVGWLMIHNNHDLSNTEDAIKVAREMDTSKIHEYHLYEEKIGNAASIVSAIPEVRDILLKLQQDFANKPSGAVLDGRDIGTVICPNADIKLFITADIAIRARRRFNELIKGNSSITYEQIFEELERRDNRDSKRSIAPLVMAKDAIHIDTTHMNIENTLDYVISLIDAKLTKPVNTNSA